MSSDDARERFREALIRREEERDDYRAYLAGAASIRDYLTIQFENQSAPLQTRANIGYSSIKRLR
jgi:hypothetical protein